MPAIYQNGHFYGGGSSEPQEQANWNETDTEANSYIKNKPAALPASDVYDWAKTPEKPAYTAAEVGAPALDKDGKVPATYLPSYVDDVLAFATKANFPKDGESGIIYIAEDTNKTYRWGGTGVGYVVIGSDLALGETASTAYAGDKGKATTDALATHKADTTVHITAAERTAWNGKQSALSTTQMSAVNSGITSTKVAAYDGYKTSITELNEDLAQNGYGEFSGSYNIFNKNKIIIGVRLDTRGNEYNEDGYYSSNFIKVEFAQGKITKNSPMQDAFHRICFYDENFLNISVSPDNTNIIPSNAKYIRICGEVEEIDTTQVEYGEVSTPYKPYFKSNKQLTKDVDDINSNLNTYLLVGNARKNNVTIAPSSDYVEAIKITIPDGYKVAFLSSYHISGNYDSRVLLYSYYESDGNIHFSCRNTDPTNTVNNCVIDFKVVFVKDI